MSRKVIFTCFTNQADTPLDDVGMEDPLKVVT